MALTINTNAEAANASRLLGITQGRLGRGLEQLASGRRINRGADDAAGLAISEVISAQVRGLSQAVRNAQDGVSVVQIADGALSQTSVALQRIRELTVQAGNGTLSTEQRGVIQAEIDSLQGAIDQFAGGAQFNSQPLLDGSAPAVTIQTGANAADTQTFDLPDATAASLGVGPGSVDVSTPAAANASLAAVDAAIDQVSSARAELGAQQNGLERIVASNNVAIENQASALSRIRDLDVAQGVARNARDQILAQFGAAVQAQANVSRQSVLQLLR